MIKYVRDYLFELGKYGLIIHASLELAPVMLWFLT